MKEEKKRLDQLLVEKGLTPTRSQALALVLSGKVLADGIIQTKPGTSLPIHASLELIAPPRYVGRGGLKLEKALAAFNVNPQNKICLDVGASTGGFTDCLLQHGAQKVYAVDVGKGQIAWKLRQNPKVTLLEKVNARNLSTEEIPESIDLCVMDVSFISIKKILPAVKLLLKPEGQIIPLIKPQFEAGRKQVKKGIVSDPAVHEEVLTDLLNWFSANGFKPEKLTHSPITGGDGNIEFLVLLGDAYAEDLSATLVVAEAHREFHR